MACGVGVAVGGCVALALALPAYALKEFCAEQKDILQEILESRLRRNVKRHLRRQKSKLNFGVDLDAPCVPSKFSKVYAQCSPPQYEDLFVKSPSPPPPYPAVQ